MLYFWNVFADISKCGKIANLGYGNGRNSKTIYPIYMILVDICRRPISTKPWRAFFNFFTKFLNYVIKFPDWPPSWLPWQEASKIRFHGFVRIVLMYHPHNFESTAKIWVLGYVCYRVWPIRGSSLVTMATRLKRQPFSKVRVMGFVVVYHPCGLAFRKVLKFDVENWAVDHWTPTPLNIGKNTRAPMEACISGVRPL